MADIFISYSSKDRTQARKLCERLSADGYSCWIDESGIEGASQWSSEIVEAIEECSVFIILLSHSALNSHYVAKELSLASEEKKHILPITLENIKLTRQVKLHLTGLQHVSIHEHEKILKALSRLFNKHSRRHLLDLKRHLRAVMFTDIKNYSKIMNTNEKLAIDILKFHNKFLKSTIEHHEGKVIEIIGDAFLATFESAVEAVSTGIAIQDGLRKHIANWPEQKRFQIRIGIHSGDIIEEETGIKGDTVNIAARIQSIAPGGGIAVSENVYEDVRHKLNLNAVSMGPQKLKNIQDEYIIYTLSSPEKSTQESNEQQQVSQMPEMIRRLAVLPFEDQSLERNNEPFSDGLTDELISTLNKLDKVFVLDRQTSKMYKEVRKAVKQIAHELNVRYIVTGGVRKQDKNLRVQAALIDSEDGKTLWDEKFSGTMDNIFEIQESIARDIAAGLKLKLTPEEDRLIQEKPTQNAEAYEIYLRAKIYYDRHTKQDFEFALQLAERAVKLDEFASGYALISQIYSEIYRLYERNESLLTSSEMAAKKALDCDTKLPVVYHALSELYLQKGEFVKAIDYAKQEEKLGAMTAGGYAHLAFLYSETNHAKEAAFYYEESLKLNMNHLPIHYSLCLQYDILNNHDALRNSANRALPYFERYLEKNPDDKSRRMDYAVLLEFSGDKKRSLQETETITSFPNVDSTILFNSACIFIRNGKLKEGLATLNKALLNGLSDIDSFLSDPDLDPIRKTPEFKKLLKKLEGKKETAKTTIR